MCIVLPPDTGGSAERKDIMERIWKLMETLIEYYGFLRDDSNYIGNNTCVDIYVYENNFGDRQVIFRVEYDSRDMKIDEVLCEIINLDTGDTLLDESLNRDEINNLSNYLDRISAEYGIN